ncbi:MAG: hypothetical protein RJB38_1173 [Pseudomonadota bacterium]|jgi:hypothetical protein
MTAWVHLFSKFTSEALLFEAAFICLLLSGYLTYAVIRKRQNGLASEAIPSSVVKVYLNELITDAEHLRSQLFGLLHSHGIMPPHGHSSEASKAAMLASLQAHGSSMGAAGALGGAGSSEMLHQISALETRMREQAQAMELLVQEKNKIETELHEARANAGASSEGGAAGASASGEAGNNEELHRRIAQLEAKLSEYAIIEDDLANLKRLQQENAQLKFQLEQARESPGAAAPAAAKPENPEKLLGSSPEMLEAEAALSPALPPAQESAPPSDSDAELEAAFNQLANQVDASLTEPESVTATPPPSEAGAVAAPSTDPVASMASSESAEPPVSAAPTTEAPAAAPAKADDNKQKSEADLLAEFEKMLNG